MITANELRTGNIVYLTKSNFKTVKGYQLDAFDIYKLSENDCSDVKPIIITREWLLKLRFKRKERKSFSTGKEVLFYTYKLKGFTFNTVQEQWYYKGVFLDDIKYVHQLQNLYFALTQKELTFKN
jgi:phosphotransferase system IIA component